jgi:hypothetical protein
MEETTLLGKFAVFAVTKIKANSSGLDRAIGNFDFWSIAVLVFAVVAITATTGIAIFAAYLR